MYLRMAKRVLLETDKRLVWKLAYNMGFKGMRSVQRHKRRLKRGEFFPPFLYISIINSCNLRCQGCWVDVAAKQQTIDLAAMNKMINEAKEVGKEMRRLGNVTPLVSIEGTEIISDERRGRPDVLSKTMAGLHNCLNNKL